MQYTFRTTETARRCVDGQRQMHSEARGFSQRQLGARDSCVGEAIGTAATQLDRTDFASDAERSRRHKQSPGGYIVCEEMGSCLQEGGCLKRWYFEECKLPMHCLDNIDGERCESG